MAITFKRTLHPVGNGAFFTEEIYDDGKRFAIAYDCGSKSYSLLNNAIERLGLIRFDCIFISHFDYDHVNGLVLLWEKKLINEQTKIFIPYYSLRQQLYLYWNIEKNLEIIEALDILKKLNAPVYFVRNAPETEPLNHHFSLTGKNTFFPETELLGLKGYDVHGRIIGDMERQWHYISFCLAPDSSITKDESIVYEKLNELGLLNKYNNIDCEKFTNIFRSQHDLKDGDVNLSKERVQLKKLYYEIGLKNINANSLQLLSYSDVPINDFGHHWTRVTQKQNYPFEMNFHFNGQNRNAPFAFGSCLYTGDADYSKPHSLSMTKNVIHSALNSLPILMMQIPHHGSSHNYSGNLYQLAKVGFVNYNPSSKSFCSFHDELYADFLANQRFVISITDSFGAEMIYHF